MPIPMLLAVASVQSSSTSPAESGSSSVSSRDSLSPPHDGSLEQQEEQGTPRPPKKDCGLCRKSKRGVCVKCERAQKGLPPKPRKSKKNLNPSTAQASHENTTTSWLPQRQSKLIIRIPQSHTTTIASHLISRLEIADLRYDLSAYGEFLKDLPMRLGRNRALDAAVDLLNVAFTAVHIGEATRETYDTYGRALRLMGREMRRVDEKTAADTLCAIYLVVVAESWMKIFNTTGAHGAAMAYLLRSVPSKKWVGEFDEMVLLTLLLPVILESMVNPKIELGPWFQEMLHRFSDNSPNPKSTGMKHFGQMPQFLRRPADHLDEMKDTYAILMADIRRMKAIMESFLAKSDSLEEGSIGQKAALKLVSRGQARYGILLTYATGMNRMLRIHELLVQEWESDAAELLEETLALAKATVHLRPLASSYMPLALVSSWAATSIDDQANIERIENWLHEWQPDFTAVHWEPMAKWLRRRFDISEARFLGLPIPPPPGGWQNPDGPKHGDLPGGERVSSSSKIPAFNVHGTCRGLRV